MAPRYPGSTFLEAAQYTHAIGSNGTVTRIVIHDMEMAEGNATAESCARMFHTTTAQKSAHFTVDNTSVVQCVDIDRRAWHAPPNLGSIGIEHAGYANQTRAQWLDPFGISMLNLSARLSAWLCRTLSIPARWLTVAQLRAGERGLCTHADVSNAWGQTDHTDPGPNFPKDWYLRQVQSYLTGATNGGEDVPLDDTDITKIQKGILYYDLGREAVNPLTLLSRTYSMVSSLITGEKDQDRALAAIQAMIAAQADVIAAKVVAALPPAGSGEGGQLTPDDVEAAVKSALREGVGA